MGEMRAEVHHIEVHLDLPAPFRPISFFFVEFIILEGQSNYFPFNDGFGRVDSG